MTTHTPESKCLNCGYVMDAATGFGPDNKPSEGDIAICFRCGAVMAFGKDLKLRGLSDQEIARIEADSLLVRELSLQIQGRRLLLYTRRQKAN